MYFSELYKYLKTFRFDGDYCVFVDKEDNCYKIDLFDTIRYIQDYITDDYICNLDELCDLIETIASNYDLPILLSLFKNLDYNVTKNEWLTRDSCYWDIVPFNNLKELGEIYDIAEIVEDILQYGRTEEYCTYIPNQKC